MYGLNIYSADCLCGYCATKSFPLLFLFPTPTAASMQNSKHLIHKTNLPLNVFRKINPVNKLKEIPK